MLQRIVHLAQLLMIPARPFLRHGHNAVLAAAVLYFVARIVERSRRALFSRNARRFGHHFNN